MAGLEMNEDRLLLRRSARDLAKTRSPVAALRKLRDERNPSGFDRGFYRELCELGVVGLVFPERIGGAGLGYVELGLVMEELGRSLAATPLWSTVGLAGRCLQLAGGHEPLLRAVCAGEALLALGYGEGPHHAPERCAAVAQPSAGGFLLSGTKRYVVDGHVADQLIVSARIHGEEPSLFMVPAGAAGLSVERVGLVDSRNSAHVTLQEVRVGEEALVGARGKALELLEATFDGALALLSAEMLGTAQAAFEMTIEYLKTRKQFGVPIGSFQALKHRAADLYAELELTRSVVGDALAAIDEGRADRGRAASTAKARASDVLTRVTAEGIQMHGGIGVTDEHDIGLYYKRARVLELLLGNGDYHRRRFATLSGY